MYCEFSEVKNGKPLNLKTFRNVWHLDEQYVRPIDKLILKELVIRSHVKTIEEN